MRTGSKASYRSHWVVRTPDIGLEFNSRIRPRGTSHALSAEEIRARWKLRDRLVAINAGVMLPPTPDQVRAQGAGGAS